MPAASNRPSRPQGGPVLTALLSCALACGLLGCSAPIERTVVYDARYGDATSMDVFMPDDGRIDRPAVFIVHGGAWRLFHKERYRNVGRRLARAGYVAVSVEYRLVPEGRFPNAVHDVGCALAYLQNHAAELGVDPARIVTFGYSAGAHLTALVATATDPMLSPTCLEGVADKPAGVISAAGPMDMLGLADVDVVHEFMGGSPTSRTSDYILASPISHVSADDPPFLFIHGTRDLLVPVQQSVDMQDQLAAAGVDSALLRLRFGGHFVNSADDPSSLDVSTVWDNPESFLAIIDFIERTVGAP